MLPAISAIPLAAALALLAAPATEQQPARGGTTEHIACRIDPTQTYALYLPPAYSTDRTWPVVILMDPRGHAMVPIGLFQQAAARRGYILMSSYDTASDGPWEPNEKAIKAMLPEAQQRYAIDTHRIYLAGFSGTARVGWDFGLRLKERVAGLIGFGGGLPFESSRLQSVPFVFFGGAGRLDFNFEEMRALDARLESMHVPHRFESYDGPHSWGPEPICAEAIDWMEIQAMKKGLRPKDDTMLNETYSKRRDLALSLEAAGDPYSAWLAYRSLERDFAGLHDVTGAAAKVAELEKSRTVRAAIGRAQSAATRQTAYESRLSTFLRNFHAAEEPPPLATSLTYLQIAALKRRAADQSDPLESEAAKRLIEMVFVQVAFYEPRQFMEQSDPWRALAMLEVALEIKPEDPRVLLGQARAYARMGRKDKGIDALRRAVDAGVSDPALIEGDAALEPLKGEAGYRDILQRLRPPA
ncbi:MAG TPA: tetratricopeptide repeat protein [Patescibacteria group bacterium]|nr:tetratricopeptide repeat protein [Patescibacteria group bacterium]